MNASDHMRAKGVGGVPRGRALAAGSAAMGSTLALGTRIASLCACAAACALVGQGLALANTTPQPPVASANPADRLAASRDAALRRPVRVTDKARSYYVTRWGVDKLRVSSTSSGNLIRFSYRVADPQHAATSINQPANQRQQCHRTMVRLLGVWEGIQRVNEDRDYCLDSGVRRIE